VPTGTVDGEAVGAKVGKLLGAIVVGSAVGAMVEGSTEGVAVEG